MSSWLYLPLGILPSLIWLAIYLRNDPHPEAKKTILKIFFLGMLATLPAFFLETAAQKILEVSFSPTFFLTLIYFFLGVALVEEFWKYFVVKITFFKSPEFDEPVDAMIYLITSALGFAAIENILIFFSLKDSFSFSDIYSLSLLRFWGATFLHTLTSATLGYFIAKAILNPAKKIINLATGFSLAVLLHGSYNLFIITQGEYLKIIGPALIIFSLAIFVIFAFKDLKTKKALWPS